MIALDGDFFLIGPGAAEIARLAPQDCPGFGIDEQLGDVGFGQPLTVGADYRDDIRGLVFDGKLARPGQGRPSIFTSFNLII